MNAWGVVVGIGLAVPLVLLAVSRLRAQQECDLGKVSDQWIAERRLGQGHDLHR